ncbi:hypothetical protein H5410_056093 [Solanum commersonii]|uniref:Uncharacterized protein n=1 Tax=Solanum commersonii TaxID=4109 RepID=A0A9J5WL38_SOLCO|nr:hypothetical protein H5410_056093 [Solanum commersonii]
MNTSITTLLMVSVGPKGKTHFQDFGIFFAKIFHGRPLRHYYWRQFVLRDKLAHFQVQMSPKAGKLDLSIFASIGLEEQTSAFLSKKWAPKQEKIDFYRFSCAIVHGFLVILDSRIFLLKFFMDVRHNLINGVSWSHGENKHIFKFKRAPNQWIFGDTGFWNYLLKYFMDVRCNLINGISSSRRANGCIFKIPFYFSKFSWMSVTTLIMESVHLEGVLVHEFLVIQDSEKKFAEIFQGRSLQPY